MSSLYNFPHMIDEEYSKGILLSTSKCIEHIRNIKKYILAINETNYEVLKTFKTSGLKIDDCACVCYSSCRKYYKSKIMLCSESAEFEPHSIFSDHIENIFHIHSICVLSAIMTSKGAYDKNVIENLVERGVIPIHDEKFLWDYVTNANNNSHSTLEQKWRSIIFLVKTYSSDKINKLSYYGNFFDELKKIQDYRRVHDDLKYYFDQKGIKF
jgi:hypothetical protein